MKREQSASERGTPSHPRAPGSGTVTAWTIHRGDLAFPPQLAAHPQAADWPTLYGLGNKNILQRKCLGLICSVQCPGSVVIKTFDAIRELRDAGIVVAGGFHSPMEQECLDFLLRGDQPVIICPARHPSTHRLFPAWRSALDANRMVIISPFGSEVQRTTQALAQIRNEFVAALCAAVLIPHAAPGGKAELTAANVVRNGNALFAFIDEENGSGLSHGMRQYNIDFVVKSLASQSTITPV